MAKHGKKYLDAMKLFSRDQYYSPLDAVDLVKKTSYAKFDGTVETHVRLVVDPRHADQQVRSTVLLPAGLGKQVRILVFAEGDAARLAEQGGADYIGLGPICQTGSKKDAGPVCGFDLISRVKKSVSIPVIAIGGLGPQNVKEAIGAGADGLAVISAVVSQDDITAATKHLKALIEEAKRQKVYEG